MKKPVADRAGEAAKASPPPADSAPAAKGSKVAPEVSAAIGRQLRTMYDHLMKEPVPDRFLDLISKLETKPGTSPASGPAGEGSPAADDEK